MRRRQRPDLLLLAVLLAGLPGIRAGRAEENAASSARVSAVAASGDLALLPGGEVVSLPSGRMLEGFGKLKTLSGDSQNGCGVRASGTAFCWTLDGANHTVAKPIPGLEEVVTASGSLVEGCAAKQDGSVTCWDRLPGERPEGPVPSVERVPDFTRAEVAPLDRPLRLTPRTDLHDVVALLGGRDGCALDRDGRVLCWGRQYERQKKSARLVLVNRSRARAIARLPRIRQIAGGHTTRCALGENGRVYCWGHRLAQQPTTASVLEAPFDERPRPVAGLAGVLDIAVSDQALCAVRKSGRVVCRGRVVGDQASRERVERQIASIKGARSVTLTLGGGCAVLREGGLACWGQP